jgi:hypothetical protein
MGAARRSCPVPELEEESEFESESLFGRACMPYFSDLTPYSFLLAKDEVNPNLLNVGWLSRSHSFRAAAVEARLVEKLLRLCRKPVRVSAGSIVVTYAQSPRIR